MMGTKKLLLSIMLIFFIAAAELQAGEDRKNQYYFDVGSAFFLYIPFPHIGFSADFPIGDNLVLSPETNVTFFLYLPVFLSIGTQINYIGDRYFWGCGVSRYFLFYEEEDIFEYGLTCLKVQVGRSIERCKVSLFAILPLLSGWNLPMIGVSFKFKL